MCMRARGAGVKKSIVNRCRAVYRVVKQLVNIQSTYIMHNVVVCTERAYVPETWHLVTVLNCKTIAARDKRKTKSNQSRARNSFRKRVSLRDPIFLPRIELHAAPAVSLIAERQHDRGGVSLGVARGDQLPAQKLRLAVPQAHPALPAEGPE